MTLLATRTSEPIPGYRVVERIGAGGYGEVWTAEAPGGLTKAIKFVYGLLDEDRASRELKALNRIKGVRHPFLLSLERIEVIDGQLVIVTELADSSLKDRFDQCRKTGLPGIPRDELLSHLRDTADALDYMTEQHSLQHLDVKPENLLLVGGRIKVADFGLVKDIHDHTASMMGGLTPVYAPPEVFEGRPSRRSDQYSLAIVYQEMLTGVVPFPGRTAAQLAAQHLNGRPKLNVLSQPDQVVIGRALSKRPDGRFNSCKELVEALVECGRRKTVVGVSGAQPASASDCLGPTIGATQAANAVANAGRSQSLDLTAPRTPDQMLAHLDQTVAAISSENSGGDGGLQNAAADSRRSALDQPQPIVDMPPVDVEVSSWQARPTLFIGLGGAGGQVLARLRRRLYDRLDDSARGQFPLLVLDSDQRELSELTSSDTACLAADDTLILPLRKTQDYRADSRRILEWLSRRWLYNIPRSQLTEGLRPLGRLALVDHAESAMGRLRESIRKLQEAGAQTGKAPRVVVVTAIGGGTGGGMVTDVLFAARQLLDEAKLQAAEVHAILLHATTRNPQQQELSTANALATLTELGQFQRTPYPGDEACKLQDRSADRPAINSTYLVHVGEELSSSQFHAACDQVAEFLMLDSVTATSAALDTARGTSTPEPGRRQVRTFGLCQIGFAQDELVDRAVKRVSRAAIERWLGTTRQAETRQSVRLIGGTDQPRPQAGNPQLEIERSAGRIVSQLRLDSESLIQIIHQFAADEMGGNPDAFYRTLAAGGLSQPDAATIERWLAQAADVFGQRVDVENGKPPPARLGLALENRIAELIEQMGQGLRASVEALIEDPLLRVQKSQRVAKALQTHLKLLCDQLRSTRDRLKHEGQTAEAELRNSLLESAKGKGPRRSAADIQAMFFQHCRIRTLEIAAQIAATVAHALQSHTVMAFDALVDLGRELHHLAVQLATDELLDEETSASSEDQLSALKARLTSELHKADDYLAEKLDERLSKEYLIPLGGLRKCILAGGSAREALVGELQSAARTLVLAQLAEINVAATMLNAAGSDHPLRDCLATAEPWLQQCGGKRRLFCVVPTAMAETLTPGALAVQIGPGHFRQLPAVIPDTGSDVVLLYEIGDIPLEQAASAIIRQRPEMIELASRLHTRCDVSWSPLL